MGGRYKNFTIYFPHSAADVDGDKNLVDLAFAGEDLDFIYVMSETNLYKLSGLIENDHCSECQIVIILSFRNGSHRKKCPRLYLDS